MDPPYGTRITWTESEDSPLAGIPKFAFLFTIDQICGMIGSTPDSLAKQSFRMGIDSGKPALKKLKLININVDPGDPEWRVDYKEFRRWCQHVRVPVYRFD